MRDWKQTLISPKATVREAVRVIDAAALQIALVVDDEGRLLGTVTDGDVRRAILSGVSLDDDVAGATNQNPTTAKESDDPDALLALMRRKRLHQIPRVDLRGRVVGLEVLDDLLSPEPKPNAVVLMAGGLGTRLRPLTNDTPKPLLRVGPKPILQTILEAFASHGFSRFYLSVNYLAEQVEEHFGDGSQWGVQIEYLREKQRLGTAGALSLLPETPEAPFFVMNGDLLTRLNFAQLLDFHTQNGAAATMCVREYEMQVPYGVIDIEEHSIVDIREKPTERYLVNGGVYVLDPSALSLIPTGERFDMPDLFTQLISEQRSVAAFPIREYWMDIGQPEDFHRANGHFDEVFA
ncbi:nucleotidyltransferase family protein [Rubricoccus marinus]|uniref:Alcohol dehydrogenase n=1 Tax=Rubricoccus marinus TaxID=716817 RepID=A0A259U0A2_9BACT|nr:nucleotidyltransferase family protein [Rubricoccus marinus]OZC03432.1 alcohol dehydrogenase [Rubricoccus marinus]